MNYTPDFPPLTPRQLTLLEKIKAEKEKLRTLPPWDPETGTWVPEFYRIQKRIDDLSVKALRSGLLRGLPAESRRPGFRLVFDSHGECGRFLPGAGDFHPELPPWAENHFIEWIKIQRSLRKEGRETLRETNIVGLESGIKRPKNISEVERWELIRKRVLDLRGAKEKEDEDGNMSPQMNPPVANESTLNTMAEKIEKYRVVVITDAMLKSAKQQSKTRTGKKRERTRKYYTPMDMVIDKLVEEGLLSKKISHQAFKKMLMNHLPDFPWNKI